MIKVEDLLKTNIDPIPKYLLLRDVLKLESDHNELISAKREVLKTKWVNQIVNLQWDDGSWGQFHSLSQFSSSVMTTEQALRRLLIMGLDKKDEPIKKALSYMEKYLLRELDLRDYKEKKHDWDLLTRLFVATWMIILDPSNVLAREIARNWANVISYAFSGEKYSHERYTEAYYAIHKSPKDKCIWGFQNFYLVSLLSKYLTRDIESKFLDYIMSSEQGIYYIYEKCLKNLPDSFCSKQASRCLSAFELISNYSLSSSKCMHLIEWIYSHLSKDGFWDMEQSVKDNLFFPLSNSWRRNINRKIDCTVRIRVLLSKI